MFINLRTVLSSVPVVLVDEIKNIVILPWRAVYLTIWHGDRILTKLSMCWNFTPDLTVPLVRNEPTRWSVWRVRWKERGYSGKLVAGRFDGNQASGKTLCVTEHWRDRGAILLSNSKGVTAITDVIDGKTIDKSIDTGVVSLPKIISILDEAKGVLYY